MLNVRVAGDYPYGKKLFAWLSYGKKLFTWLSPVMSLMVPLVLFLFQQDVLDGIWNLIRSVPKGFPTYYFMGSVSGDNKQKLFRHL